MNNDNQQALALQQEATQLTQVLDQYRSIQVKDQPTADFCNKVLIEVKTRAKALTEQEKTATAPINQALTTIRGWFRPVKDGYGQIETLLKGKLAEWDREVRALEAARLQAATEAFQAGAQETGLALLNQVQVSQDTATTAKGTSVRTTWDFEITAPNSVPRELCSPDEKLIRAAVKLGHREIPGVRVFEKQIVTVRT